MKIKPYKTHKQWHQEQMQDPEYAKAYNDLEFEFAVIDAIIQQRIEKGLTQKQLADKLGMKQSAIARFESSNYNPTLDFLNKIANALGLKLTAIKI